MSTVLMVFPGAFRFGWMGATRRILDVANAFRKLGYSVALLSDRSNGTAVQTELDALFPGPVLRTGHSGDYPPALESSGILRRMWRGSWKVRGSEFYWAKLSWGWNDRLDVDAVLRALKYREVTPSILWGSSTGTLGGPVVAQRIAAQIGVPWVMELHDPPIRAGIHGYTEAVAQRFHGLVDAASCVIVTAKTYGDYLLRHTGLDEHRLQVIRLSHHCDALPEPLPTSGRFRLVYTGSLSAHRSLKPLLLALLQVQSELPVSVKQWELMIAGSGGGIKEIRRFVRQHRVLAPVVRILGARPALFAFQLLLSADVAVVVQPQVNYYQIPGKVYDGLCASKPMIGIMPEDSEAAWILRQSGLGFIHEEHDIEGLTRTLVRLWQSGQAASSPVHPNRSFIAGFSAELLPQRLEAVLRTTFARV